MFDYLRYSAVILLISFMLAGCVSSRSGSTYSRDQARQAHTVQYGVVDAVRPVNIEGTRSGVGAVAGGAAGGVLGNTIGSGSGRTVATVLGAIAGGAAGHAAEEGLTKKQGIEITVKLDNGQLMAVVQEADEDFQPGDRVRVLTGSDRTVRVAH